MDGSELARPAPRRDIAADVIAPLILLTGLWVAVSPRFLPLRHGAADAAAAVIIGAVVVGIGTLALVGRHGRHFASLVLGVWAVLITAFIRDARVSPAAPLSWSNTWSGAVLALLALAELARTRTSQRGVG
jgi:hypothetical protein